MSEIKVNKISPRTNCGTVTLGDSGDTFTIPAGATINNQGTATNFGATGSASWTTTVKTGDFTAVAGEGYFVDTSSGEIDVALPAGTAGAVVAVADYAKNFGTNNCILVQNGSDKINGSTTNAILSTDGLAITLIFIDSTKGWIVTDDGQADSADTNPFIEATGGTITTSGSDKIHTFTGPGTFSVSALATCSANNQVSYIVVAGGGSGGAAHGGGGGAGGFREDKSPTTPYTASPLEGAGAITVTATSFPITVGAGGTATPCGTGTGNSGSVSTFSTITSAGGGGGGGESPSPSSNRSGAPGGSGGGRGADGPATGIGSGNTPPTSPAQGTNRGGNNHNPPGMVQVVAAEQPLLELMGPLLQVVMEVQAQRQVLMVHPQLLVVVVEDLHIMVVVIQQALVELVVEEMEQDKIIQLELQEQLILVVVEEVVKEVSLLQLDLQVVLEL